MKTSVENASMREASPEPVVINSPPVSKTRIGRVRLILCCVVLLVVLGVVSLAAVPRFVPFRWVSLVFPPATSLYAVRYRSVPDPLAARFVKAARAQIGTRYDASYQTIDYPGGDVPPSQGACTDVVVRSLRAGGFDLQKLIHEDMRHRRGAYPNSWGVGSINANIDHRRVPNQMAFLRRHGKELTRQVSSDVLKQWLPGDLVYWKTGHNKWHTGVISDGLDSNGIPLVIHNGSICAEDNCLTRWPIIGHFRYPR